MEFRVHRWTKLLLGGVLLLLAGGCSEKGNGSEANQKLEMRPLEAQSAAALASKFNSLEYDWPPSQEEGVPPVALQELPPDMAELDIPTKKATFFRLMLPLALAENRRIERLRNHILDLYEDGVEEGERDELIKIGRRYRLEGDPADPKVQQVLLRRVDTIPLSLVLAQAANESGWGTSRFARQGNSLFGEWTWTPDSGLRPQEAAAGTTHSVRTFPDLQSSVRSYIGNLNTGSAYHSLRMKREELRREGKVVDGVSLAAGLLRYSERGEEYIAEIRQMIRGNELMQLRGIDFRHGNLSVAER